MFIPNTTTQLYVKGDAKGNFGKHYFDAPVTVRCSVIYINVVVEKSNVRADTSGSRGQVDQTQGQARFLFPKTVKLKIGDVIFMDNNWLECIEFKPMRNVMGPVDHNQAEFRKCAAVA